MDNSACAVLYLDRRVSITGSLTRQALDRDGKDYLAGIGDEDAARNIHTLLVAFGEAYVCSDGVACLTKVAHLDESRNSNPIIVLLDITSDDEASHRKSSWDARTPSPTASKRLTVEKNEPNDLYGLHLLLYLTSEIQQRARSRLVIPVAVLRSRLDLMTEPMRVSRYLDAGAVDVLNSPLTFDRVQGLAVHAYRRYKEVSKEESNFALTKRNRKLSWVGIDEERPYAYLREVMVSGLMDGICNPDTIAESIDPSDFHIDPQTMEDVEKAIGTWSFSAHQFDADALLYAALVMLEHALTMPELDKWKMSTDDLTTFLMACRKAYNDFVLYHNFRHIVDVLQAVFFFLLQIGILPPYTPKGSRESTNAVDAPTSSPTTTTPITSTEFAPLATLLKPFDALTLLISAIGHDVGHPGVNNAFLVALNAPLAQLYNDRSVLEAFHCAAYSQILRRYWPEAFSDTAMRKLMINSILATDMGLHFKYMVDMSNLQERVNASPIDDWSPKTLEETRDLCCGLLIKCADISNVAREYDTAAQWAAILTDEFSNQGAMEEELNLPTCLFGGPPVRDDIIKMAESQIGFMTIFARPLFESMTRLMPAMKFGVQAMHDNQTIWNDKIQTEKTKRSLASGRSPQKGLGYELRNPGLLVHDEHPEHESEGLPPLPVERDSLFGPSRSSNAGDDASKLSSDSNIRPQSEGVMSSAERRLRNTSMGSNSPIKAHRKTSGSGSFNGPFGSPFGHGGSRRSSKDAALEQLEQMQYSSFSRMENQSFDSGRRGSADASLTTILVRSQTPQSKPDPNTSSPTKGSFSQSSQSGGCFSLPSSPGNATNDTLATNAALQSPSTQASSLNDSDPSTNATGDADAGTGRSRYLRPDSHANEQRQTLSAPDILGSPDVRRSKVNLVSMAKEGNEEGEEGRNGRNGTIRQSRSRSRLRGLRFWRKRWKSPSGVEVDQNE